MLSINENWLEAFSQSPIPVQHIVTIQTGVRHYLTVLDYTLASGLQITSTLNGIPTVWTEGVDFDAGNSNEKLAANIAFRLSYVAGAGAWSEGSRVTDVVQEGSTLSLASSIPSAVSVSPAPLLAGSVSFVTGPVSRFGYSNVVADVSPLATEIDPIDRKYSSGDKTIDFGDAGPGSAIRHLLAALGDLNGKLVTVRLGTRTLAESDFIGDGTYMIEEMEPGPGFIRLICKGVNGLLEDQEILPGPSGFIARHPLACLLGVLQLARVPTQLYDAASLDETTYSHIGHWSVTRAELGIFQSFGNSLLTPTSAADLVSELMEILDASFAPDENGVFSLERFDPERAISRHIPRSDIRGFEPVETWSNIKNHVIVDGGITIEAAKITQAEVEDFGSQFRHGVAGGRARKSMDISSPWLNALGRLGPPNAGSLVYYEFPTGDLTMHVRWAPPMGFCGQRFTNSPPDMTQPTNSTLSSSRPAYLMLFASNGQREIVRAEAATPNTTYSSFQGYWGATTYTLVERGLFGTTEQLWRPFYSPDIFVVDVTIAVDLARRKIARLAHGVTIYDMVVPPKHYALQVRDFITLDNPLYAGNFEDGANENIVWEIIRKEPLFYGDSPGINLRIARVRAITPSPLEWTPREIVVPTPDDDWLITTTGDVITTNGGDWVRR